MALMKLIEGTDHEKFVVIVALRKTFLCRFKQLVNAFFIIMFKGFVGGCVERVFNLFASARILCIMGTAQLSRRFALWIFLFESLKVVLCQGGLLLAHVDEIQPVIHFIALCKGWKLMQQAQQVTLAEIGAVEQVVKEQSAVEKGLRKLFIAGL